MAEGKLPQGALGFLWAATEWVLIGERSCGRSPRARGAVQHGSRTSCAVVGQGGGSGGGKG